MAHEENNKAKTGKGETFRKKKPFRLIEKNALSEMRAVAQSLS